MAYTYKWLQVSKIQQIGAYSKAEWWPLSDLPHLAFDHYDIMQDAIERYNSLLKQKG